MKYHVVILVVLSYILPLVCNADNHSAAINKQTCLSEKDTSTTPQDFYFDVEALSIEPEEKDRGKIEFHGLFKVTTPIKGRDDDSQQPSSKFLDENELILWFGKRITKKLSFLSEVEIKKGFKNFELEQLKFDYEMIDTYLTCRVGKFKYPFGIERFVEDGPFDRLIDRPLPSIRIIPGTYSDIGGMLSGNAHFSNNTVLKYEFAVTNGIEGPGTKEKQELWDNNASKRLGGRLGLVCFPGFEIGCSYSWGKYDNDNKLDIDFIGADFQLKRGNLEIRGEYITSRVEQEDEDGDNFHRNGYYIQTSYRYPFHLNYLRYIEGVFRFDSVDPNRNVTDGNEADRVAIGLNYSPMEHIELKFEYEIENEPGEEIHSKSFAQLIFRW